MTGGLFAVNSFKGGARLESLIGSQEATVIGLGLRVLHCNFDSILEIISVGLENFLPEI
jgi:hypothetical protein